MLVTQGSQGTQPVPVAPEPYQQMLELGLLFLGNAMRDFLETEEIDLNTHSALVSLFTGAEIIIKARLVKEHWALVFAEINSATKDSYEKGEYKSVGFSEAIQRLESFLRLEVPQHSRNTLDTLRKRRNRLVHSGSVDDERPVRDNMIKCLGITLSLCRKFFPGDTDLYSLYLSQFTADLAKNESYVKVREKELQEYIKTLGTSPILVRCFACSHESVIIQDGLLTCHICDADSDDPTPFVIENVNHPPNIRGANYSFAEECDGCCNDSCAIFGYSSCDGDFSKEAILCFACGRLITDGDDDYVEILTAHAGY